MQIEFKVQSPDIVVKTAMRFFQNPEREVLYNNMSKAFNIDVSQKDVLGEKFFIYCEEQIRKTCQEYSPRMEEFSQQYQHEWSKVQKEVSQGFVQVFNDTKERNLTAFLWPCMVCPYGPDYFYVSAYGNSNWFNTLNTILHETTHLYWWDLWDKAFGKTEDRKDGDSLAWLLSEIVVDPIMKNSPLKKFCQEKISNDKFYDLSINKINIIDYFGQMCRGSKDLTAFMKDSYAFVKKHGEIFSNYMYKKPEQKDYFTDDFKAKTCAK